MNSDPDRAIARELRLRAPPPRVARLSRRALLAGGAVAAAALVSAVGWGLKARTQAEAPVEPIAAAPAPPEAVTALPRDYAGLPPGTPRLGPPLPGDLGRPILAAQGADGGAAPGRAPAPAADDPEAARREEALQAARRSALFGPARQASPPERVAEATAAPAELPGLAGAEPDLRLAFLRAPPETSFVSPARLHAPPPNALLAGSVVRAALITGVRSDLPGLVLAQVTEDVFDTVTGRTLLVPQGSRLLGVYDHQVAFGQSRVLLAWTRLILPDGRSVLLGREPAADAQGYAGLSDRVDRHWRRLLAASAVSTLLGMGSQLGARDEDGELVEALRTGFAGPANQAGQQVVGRNLDVPPTLTIRPGHPVRVLISRDLVLEPYRSAPWAG